MPRRVHRFEIVLVPELLLDIIKLIPKAKRADRITLGGQVVNPPKIVFTADSQEDVNVILPGLIASMPDDKQCIFVVRKSGICLECNKDSANPCPHTELSNLRIAVMRIDYTIAPS